METKFDRGIVKTDECQRIRLARINWATFRIIRSYKHPLPLEAKTIVGLIGYFLSKICTPLGKDYDFMYGRRRLHHPNKYPVEKINNEIINLIRHEDVNTFLVGEIGEFEEDAYDAVIEVKKIYPDIKIVLVASKITEIHETGSKGFKQHITTFGEFNGYFTTVNRIPVFGRKHNTAWEKLGLHPCGFSSITRPYHIHPPS